MPATPPYFRERIISTNIVIIMTIIIDWKMKFKKKKRHQAKIRSYNNTGKLNK